MTVLWKKLAYESDVLLKSLFTAKGSLLTSTGASAPLELGIGADTYMLGVNVDELEYIDPTTLPVGSHKLNSHTAPDGAVNFNVQQANNMILMTVANEATLPITGIGLGEICFATLEKTVSICTVAA